MKKSLFGYVKIVVEGRGRRWEADRNRKGNVEWWSRMVTMQSAEDAISRHASGKTALTLLAVFEVIVQVVKDTVDEEV
jgi:hypothetical protein